MRKKRQSYYMNGFMDIPYTDVDISVLETYPLDSLMVKESYRLNVPTAFNVDGVLMINTTENATKIELANGVSPWQLWDTMQGTDDDMSFYLAFDLPLYIFVNLNDGAHWMHITRNMREVRKAGKNSKFEIEIEEIANTAFATAGEMNLVMSRKLVVL